VEVRETADDEEDFRENKLGLDVGPPIGVREILPSRSDLISVSVRCRMGSKAARQSSVGFSVLLRPWDVAYS